MRIRKILMLPAVFSLSAIFAFGAIAQQQEDQKVNDKVRELQDQWHKIMKDEYNPSTIQPKTQGGPSFSSDPGWMNSSKKAKSKNTKYGKASKKKGSRHALHSKKARGSQKVARAAGQKGQKPALKSGKTSSHKTKIAGGSKGKSAKSGSAVKKKQSTGKKSEFKKGISKKAKKINK